MPESIAGIVVPASGGGVFRTSSPHETAREAPQSGHAPGPCVARLAHRASGVRRALLCLRRRAARLAGRAGQEHAEPACKAAQSRSTAHPLRPSSRRRPSPNSTLVPEEQSAPVLHSFEVPEHEPTATQEADIDGIMTMVQHVWPDPHLFDGPPAPPPPPPAPGNNAAKPESGPQVTLARRLPSIPRGLAAAAPESSPALTVLPSSEAPTIRRGRGPRGRRAARGRERQPEEREHAKGKSHWEHEESPRSDSDHA